MRLTTIAPLVVLASLAEPAVRQRAEACTSILVSRGASADSSTLITYAADSHLMYGDLVIRPATENLAGSMVDVYEWDSGKRLGKIRQAPRTFAVVGNMNERQVAIGETTFSGRPELVDPTGGVDYGSLMYLALQRAATAREAVQVITDLVAEYGYASGGESFSLSDPKEAWLLELIGKGPGRKGAVWVARRVPDGMISAHANQARIRTFPLNDPQNTVYAKDVVSFAREKGYFRGKDDEFSFTDAYAPLDYEAQRGCEARVWSVFRRAAPSLKLSSDFVTGSEDPKPLPLWIRPDKKLTAHQVMELMRDHFEGTELDMTLDVGAGPFKLPYRWRPLRWEVEGVKYFHERAISTQQTGWSFVSQSRAFLPDPIGGVLWFGVDDTYSTVYVPMYAGIHQAPPSLRPGVGSLQRFSWSSAFWVFNWVSNYAYSRYSDTIQDIRAEQAALEGDFLARQPQVEQAALELYRRSPEQAREYLTRYSTDQMERTVSRWRTLGEELLVKYLDGNVKDEHGKPTHPKYSKEWYRRIAQDSGDRLRLKKLKGEAEQPKRVPVAGYFHTREELGETSKNVPADFPFGREKLLLVRGQSQCPAPPKCCLTPEPGEGGRLLLKVPEDKNECGTPDWLIRLDAQDNRPLQLP